MAIKKIYAAGSVGPLIYDDTSLVSDPDGDFAGVTLHASITDGQHWVGEAPTEDEHVVRKVDLDAITISLITDLGAGNWKTFYSNGSGAVTELALGASGDVLTSNGAAAAPSWETPTSGLWTDDGAFIYPSTMANFKIYDAGKLEFLVSGAGQEHVLVGGSGATDNPTLRLENGSGGTELFAAGNANAYLTGSAQGDAGLMFDSGQKFLIGIQNATYLTAISDGTASDLSTGNFQLDIPAGKDFIIRGATGQQSDPGLELFNRNTCGNGAGGVIRFVGYNDSSQLIRAVQLNGGLVDDVVGTGCTAGSEESDLDLVMRKGSGSSVIAWRTDVMAYYPETNNVWDIGRSGQSWKNIYASSCVYTGTSTNFLQTNNIKAYSSQNLNLHANDGSQAMVLDTSGHLTLSTANARYKGQGGASNGAELQCRANNNDVSFDWLNGTDLTFYVDGTAVCHIKTDTTEADGSLVLEAGAP